MRVSRANRNLPRTWLRGAALAAAFLPWWAAPAAARLVDAVTGFDGANAASLPAKLSQTGLYANIALKTRAVTDGIVAFEVNSALWSDGTFKERFVTVPVGAKITATDTDKYAFPDKAVLVKNFAIDTIAGDPQSRILIETRFLVHRKAGNASAWHGVSYAWKRDQSDADLVSQADGNNAVLRVSRSGKAVGMRWRYPSAGDCLMCHSGRGTLGFITPQLNRPAKAAPSLNQLQDLVNKLVLAANPLTANPNAVKWAALDDATASLELRGRSYLASNCSHCHGNGAASGVTHDFDFLNPRMKWKADSNDLFAAGPYVGKPGPSMEFPFLLYPGHPDSSEILHRMLIRGTFESPSSDQMPRLATYRPDSAALKVLADWACVMGGKAAGACKLPAVAVPDWAPLSIRRFAAGGKGHLEFSVRPAAGGWSLEVRIEGTEGPGRVRLVDAAGRGVPVRKGFHGRGWLAEGLAPGTYLLDVGGRSERIVVGM